MRKFSRADSEGEEQINLTPMLDVVFIMLIFFIVTATFVKEVGIDVNQPEDDKPKTVDPDKRSIVVRITSRDRIIIAQRDVDVRSVRANIERLHAEIPEAPAMVPRTNPAKIATRRSQTKGLLGLSHTESAAIIVKAPMAPRINPSSVWARP